MTDQTRNSGHVELEATPARQANRGLHVLWLLVTATALAVIAMVAAFAWRAAGDDARTPTLDERQKAAATFDTPAPPQAGPPEAAARR